jgi:hypothetical protein
VRPYALALRPLIGVIHRGGMHLLIFLVGPYRLLTWSKGSLILRA